MARTTRSPRALATLFNPPSITQTRVVPSFMLAAVQWTGGSAGCIANYASWSLLADLGASWHETRRICRVTNQFVCTISSDRLNKALYFSSNCISQKCAQWSHNGKLAFHGNMQLAKVLRTRVVGHLTRLASSFQWYFLIVVEFECTLIIDCQ